MLSEPILPSVGDGSGFQRDQRIHVEELQLALRNKALPLEGLHYDITPTGLHYTLIHYDIPVVDGTSWRLDVGGQVRRQLSLTLEDLQQRPQQTLRVTLECAGDGRALLHPRPISQPWLTGAVGTAEWTGIPLHLLLEETEVGEGVTEILFTGLDRGMEGGVEQHYQRSVPLDVAQHDDLLLAWRMNGVPLEPQHGFPLRLIVPGWYGMAQVKWLCAITALTAPFDGYQQAVAYRYSKARAEQGEPVTLMRVRSLLIPPGIPDFLTRMRVVERGLVELRGRAWSGRSPIAQVEVSCDGGGTWERAEVGKPQSAYSWQNWHYRWEALTPGTYELCCRAQDRAGEMQPLDQYWTARGMGNNAVQRVRVMVM